MRVAAGTVGGVASLIRVRRDSSGMTQSTVSGHDAPQAEHIHFLFDPHATLCAFAAQRRRMAATASTLSPDELSAPSRCGGWTVTDVLRHLVWVDDIVHRVWSGDESLADGFDPRTTPDAFVQADRIVPDAEIRDRYLASTAAMSEELQAAGPERFGQPSLSPVGSVPWWLSAVHIGWDSAVHERDILVPLGRPVVASSDEALPSLAYALVMASFFSGRAPSTWSSGLFTCAAAMGR